MRTIKLGDTEVKITASAFISHLYKKDFGSDILTDFTMMSELQNMSNLLQIIYAMAKNAVYPSRIDDYEIWLYNLGNINLFDDSVIEAVNEEMTNAFFRSKKIQPKNSTQEKSK